MNETFGAEMVWAAKSKVKPSCVVENVERPVTGPSPGRVFKLAFEMKSRSFPTEDAF
jgi:hypothetical protein